MDETTMELQSSEWAGFDYELPEMEEREGPYELPWVGGCPVPSILDLHGPTISGARLSRAQASYRHAKPPWKNAVFVHDYLRHIPNKPYGRPEVHVMEHYRHAASGEHIENAMYAAAADALESYAGALVRGEEPYTEIGFSFGSIISSVTNAVSSVAKAVTAPIVPIAKAVTAPLSPALAAVAKPLELAAKKIIAPVVMTATNAAKTLVTGIRKFNPIAIAKYAAIKAKAVAGSLTHNVILSTLKSVANKALAPALTVIRAAGPVMPYVTSVLSVVPGVGSGVSAALGAAQALADGRPITDALMAGVRNAIPGGPIAQIAFDATRGLVQGKGINTIALEALRNQLPGNVQKAMDFGVAMAAAKTAQGKRSAVKSTAMNMISDAVRSKLAA